MRSMESAQAMLDLRALKINKQWDDCWNYHIERDQKRLSRYMNIYLDTASKAA